MKKSLMAIFGALVYSTLFYSQGLGLNMLLFATIAVIAVFTTHKVARRKEMYIAATLYITSALFVFTINSILSIITNIIAFMIFSGTISGVKNSIYVQWFNGLYHLFIGALHRHFHKKPENVQPVTKQNYGFIIVTTIAVLTILIIFLGSS